MIGPGGAVPKVAVFNRATTDLALDLGKLVVALQKYVDRCVVPAWGTPAKIVRSRGFVKGAYALVFLDDTDRAKALAYHNLTPDGLPVAKVFVNDVMRDGYPLSGIASHELCEMLVDPAINLYSTGPDKRHLYAYETADPVEETFFMLAGFAMSNFVYPAYFETFRKPRSTRFDYLGKLKRPYHILHGGYQIVLRNGKKSQVFGSVAKAKRFGKENRDQHRSEYRGPGHAAAFLRSKAD